VAKLIISKITFDIAALSAALKISDDDVVAAFRDGRGAWPFTEIWGAKLYEFIKHANTNQAFSDGAVALKQLRDVKISVKALTGGKLKFQQSKYVGFGRKTDKDGLIKSIEECDRIVVVDLTEFPLVRFLPIDSARLVGAAHKDELTTNGWSHKQLHTWVKKTYELSEIELAI
jgi:hypothetical protein